MGGASQRSPALQHNASMSASSTHGGQASPKGDLQDLKVTDNGQKRRERVVAAGRVPEREGNPKFERVLARRKGLRQRERGASGSEQKLKSCNGPNGQKLVGRAGQGEWNRRALQKKRRGNGAGVSSSV